MYEIVFKKQATKDIELLRRSGYLAKAKTVIFSIAEDPFSVPYEQLVCNLKGYYSKRINIQHRVVYKVEEENNRVVIYRMWSHYDYI